MLWPSSALLDGIQHAGQPLQGSHAENLEVRIEDTIKARGVRFARLDALMESLGINVMNSELFRKRKMLLIFPEEYGAQILLGGISNIALVNDSPDPLERLVNFLRVGGDDGGLIT